MSLMEFLSHIPIVSFIVLLFTTTTILNPVLATKDCDFPAIFSFGAATSDTGGMAATLLAPKSPYGETYFHRPAGRYSDGRLIIDFIAQSFGLPYLSPYLDSVGSNFSHGANFATYGSTIKPQQSIIPQGKFSPFHLQVQCNQFETFKSRTQFIRQKGGVFATLMPKKESFIKALYAFDITSNDIIAGLLGKATIEQVNASVPDTVNIFSTNVKNLYNLGARSFWIHNSAPIGCHPILLANFPSIEKDRYGCAKPYNEITQHFNQKLKEALSQLRKELPHVAITYVDIYSIKNFLFTNPKKYGFELPLVSCCGYGGKYNFSNGVGCGGTINVNGKKNFVGSCEKSSSRVMWDGIHYTEAANKFVFDKISTGAFSDPPIPLKMACHRNFTKN